MYYIALIRGINVGGHNSVNMQVLRETLEKNKFKDVRTYIQSGNIVFRSDAASVEVIENSFIKILKDNFNVNVPVLVRDEKEWARTIKRNPLLNETDDHTKLLVTFLSAKPSPSAVKAIAQFHFPHDAFVVDGKDVYLFCKDGYGKTDIPNTFFEKQLKVVGTTRNWKTVLELQKMCNV